MERAQQVYDWLATPQFEDEINNGLVPNVIIGKRASKFELLSRK